MTALLPVRKHQMAGSSACSKILVTIVALTLVLRSGVSWAAQAAGEGRASAADKPGWDERSAVAEFLAESPLVASARAAAAVGSAGLVGAGLWPNPELQAAREQVFPATGGGDENHLGVQVPVPIGDKVGLARKVAISGGAIAGARAEVQVQEYVGDFRGAMARAHFARARGEAVAAAAAACLRVQGIVEARVAAGEEAAYDLMRVRLARAGLLARLASQEAAAREAMAGLGGLLGRPVEGSIRLADPGEALPDDAVLTALLDSHPEIRVLREERQRSTFGRELAGRRAWPDPVLALGLKESGGGVGYTAGVAWPLPVWDRAQGELAIAGAEAARWEAEERALGQRLAVELAGSLGALRRREEATGAFARDAGALAPDLVRVAETAYREGQGTILGVLDAHEAALAARLELLGLQEEVQAAKLRVERILGKPFALSDWRKP